MVLFDNVFNIQCTMVATCVHLLDTCVHLITNNINVPVLAFRKTIRKGVTLTASTRNRANTTSYPLFASHMVPN